MNEEIDELRERIAEAQKEVKHSFKSMQAAQQVFYSWQEEHFRYKSLYEQLDRELAMIDGRYKNVEQIKEKEKDKKVIAKFSTKQIMEMAEKLGVELDVEGGEEDDNV